MELSPIEQEMLDGIAKSGLQIPPRPQVVAEVQTLLQKDEPDNTTIGSLIGKDVKLTAIVFKTVNSAAYNLSRKVESVNQALTVLGQSQMKGVINAAALRQQLGGDVAQFERFWERSTDVATLCSIVATKALTSKVLNAEQAYMVGLFHDCGVPVLMQHIKGYCEDMAKRHAPIPDMLDQDDTYQTSHCLVGCMVGDEWKLPDFICHSIRAHHYVITEEQESKPAIATLQMAMHIFNKNKSQPDNEWEYHGARATETLDIAQDDLEDFEQEILESFQQKH